ncbi:Uncharacterized protein HZ326_0851 [Fusarium oxysporum f. sp. albedinis]|nr:Uncharacterized protein HZ326_0851 [Fusarium oxysporum f. sp. albedinis]
MTKYKLESPTPNWKHSPRMYAVNLNSIVSWGGFIVSYMRNQYFDSIVSHARVINELGVGVSFLESVQGSFAEEGAARGCTTLIGVEAVSTNCINVTLGERFEHERIEDLNAPSIRSWAIMHGLPSLFNVFCRICARKWRKTFLSRQYLTPSNITTLVPKVELLPSLDFTIVFNTTTISVNTINASN